MKTSAWRAVEAVGLATEPLAGKRPRSARAGEWVIANCVVSGTQPSAEVPKASDDLLKGTIETRALALWDALGTDRRPSVLVSRPGEPTVVFDYLCEAGWPHSIVAVAREGVRRGGDMLRPLLALLSCKRREPEGPGSRRRFPARDDCSVRGEAGAIYGRLRRGSDSCARSWGGNVENDQRQASQEE